MGLPFLRPIEQTSDYAVFGKLPHRPDFVRINANHPAVHELDETLATALADLSANPQWELRYDSSDAVGFGCRDRQRQHWMIGAWRASRDQAGRRFPLVAAVLRSRNEIAPKVPLVPIAYEVFLDGVAGQIDNALDNSVEALACQQFLQGYSGEAGRIAADFDLAGAVAERFSSESSVDLLVDGIGWEKGIAGLEQACLNIAFYVDFLRRFPSEANAQAIALALPCEPGKAALVAAAWIELVARLTDSRERIAAVFSRGSELFVCVDSVSRRTVAMLLGARRDEAVLDLVNEHEAWRSHRLHAETAYALSRLLADPATRIKSLLDFASHLGARLALPRP